MDNVKAHAKSELIFLLQNAHAGELAAYFAYDGHQKSVSEKKEKQEIIKIRDEEWQHRLCVAGLLKDLGAGPRPQKEFLMKMIGLSIGILCRIGGWLIPMHGAGKLESGNIVEYEIAAKLAADAGFPEMIEPLLAMAEVEWDHELYFRQKVESHRLGFFLPKWKIPPAREKIRISFKEKSLN